MHGNFTTGRSPLARRSDLEQREECALRDPNHSSRAEARARELTRVDQKAHLTNSDPEDAGGFLRREDRREVAEVFEGSHRNQRP